TDLGDWAEGRHAIPVETETLTEEEMELLAGALDGHPQKPVDSEE
ncbi:MAG: hypothetical protein JNJ49_17595, partial [Bdellovibrionaceae bacterium]|nr:hypothetical protein [Pseudobdellovibrionaceae bacterium]